MFFFFTSFQIIQLGTHFSDLGNIQLSSIDCTQRFNSPGMLSSDFCPFLLVYVGLANATKRESIIVLLVLISNEKNTNTRKEFIEDELYK